RRFRDLAERLEVLLGDEIVECRDVAARHREAHHLGRLGFGLRQPFATLGIAKRRLASALSLENLSLLLALGAQDRGLTLALGGENLGALLALRLHLPAHRFDELRRRNDVLDLYALDLYAPRRHRGVHHTQQPPAA